MVRTGAGVPLGVDAFGPQRGHNHRRGLGVVTTKRAAAGDHRHRRPQAAMRLRHFQGNRATAQNQQMFWTHGLREQGFVGQVRHRLQARHWRDKRMRPGCDDKAAGADAFLSSRRTASTATSGFAITVDTSSLALVADTATATEASSNTVGSTSANFGANPRGNLLSNDTVASSTKLIAVTGSGAAVTVNSGTTDLNNSTDIVGAYGTLRVGSDGSYTYFLNNDSASVNALQSTSTPLTDTFTYTVRNGAGASQSSTLTVNINGASDVQASFGALQGGTLSNFPSNPNGFIDHVELIPDFDGDGRAGKAHRRRQRRDAAAQRAAAAGHVGQDGGLEVSGLLHQLGGDALEVAEDVLAHGGFLM